MHAFGNGEKEWEGHCSLRQIGPTHKVVFLTSTGYLVRTFHHVGKETEQKKRLLICTYVKFIEMLCRNGAST